MIPKRPRLRTTVLGNYGPQPFWKPLLLHIPTRFFFFFFHLMCYPESVLYLLPSVPLFSFLLFCLEKEGKKILLLALCFKGNINNKTSEVKCVTITWNLQRNSVILISNIYTFLKKKSFPQTNCNNTLYRTPKPDIS